MIPHAQPARTSSASTVESTPQDLAALRWLLDLALQPLDRWQGFTQTDPLGTSALRYQLNAIGYALAMAQRTRTPAFTGYLAEAQRNAIEKMCDRRVWGYWAFEHLVGYRSWNPDPIVRSNVMYSGYLGVMIGLYEALNDDRRFDLPGSLHLRWSRATHYDYDFGRLAEAVRHNLAVRGDSPQYPCEPHLIFPTCNTFALNSLLLHDRLHGTGLTGDIVDKVRASYDRDHWRTGSGRFLGCRIEGSHRVLIGPSIGNDAFMAYWLSSILPDLAESTYAMVRDRFLVRRGEEVALCPSERRRVDPGSYSFDHGDGFTQAVTTMAARELGDEDTARALERAVEQEHPFVERSGAARHEGVSNLTNALATLARFGTRHGLRELVRGSVPPAWREGPLLAEAAYPDVLVARAESDGTSLHLVLRPGDGACRTTLGLARLRPGAAYRVTGGTRERVTADDQGRALVEVELGGRTEVHVLGASR